MRFYHCWFYGRHGHSNKPTPYPQHMLQSMAIQNKLQHSSYVLLGLKRIMWPSCGLKFASPVLSHPLIRKFFSGFYSHLHNKLSFFHKTGKCSNTLATEIESKLVLFYGAVRLSVGPIKLLEWYCRWVKTHTVYTLHIHNYIYSHTTT
jgi:hypothetical protein